MRLLSVAIAAPLLLLLLFAGSAQSWFGLVAVAAGVAGAELFAMTHRGDPVARLLGALMSVVVCATVYFLGDDPRALLTALLVLPLAGLLVTLGRLGEVETAGLRAMAAIAGPLYTGGLVASLALLRRDHGPAMVLLALLLSWLADTGGYFIGRRFGHLGGKLSPVVSPGKTRVGFLGSLLGAMAGATGAHFWLIDRPLPELLLLALVGGGLGQVGDLAASMLKRSQGIKDSGTLIPGHGGLLDRIDALLIVSPVVYLYALWCLPQ